MSSALNWIKNNKLASLLLLIIAYFLLKNNFLNLLGVSSGRYYPSRSYESSGVMYDSVQKSVPLGIGGGYTSDIAPSIQTSNRMVVQSSYLSLVVKKVAESLSQIKQYTQSIGGYMVSSNLSNPQETANADITIRIPSVKLDEALLFLKGLSVKVSSERLDGYDVTDEYVDLESRLATLQGNMARFREIMFAAGDIEQIIKVQEKIFQLQDQIDSYKGRQKYLTETSKTVLITIYLSTDEYSLPYSPSETWRPEVVFKTAVRSLVSTMRKLANAMIWLLVYSVILIPVIFIYRFVKKKFFTKQK